MGSQSTPSLLERSKAQSLKKVFAPSHQHAESRRKTRLGRISNVASCRCSPTFHLVGLENLANSPMPSLSLRARSRHTSPASISMWTAASRQFPEGFSLRDQLGDGLTRQSSTANPAPSQKPTGTFHVQELLCQEPVLVRLGQARLKFADHASGHTACGGCGDLLPFHSGEGDHGLTRGD